MTLSQRTQDMLGEFLRGGPDIMAGIPAGLYPDVGSVNKFGRNPDIDTGSLPEDIWDGGGVWAAPTQSRTHNVASTQAADAGTELSSGTATAMSATQLIDTAATFISDGVAANDIVLDDTQTIFGYVVSVDGETQLTVTGLSGNIDIGDTYRVATAASTGAAVVHIPKALDADWLEASEFVIMNGAANVPTGREYQRIYRARVILSGTGQTNAGDITFTAQVDSTLTAQISAGNGQTLMAIYTVPANAVAYLVGGYMSVQRDGTTSRALIDMQMIARSNADVPNSPWQVKHTTGLSIEGTSTYQHKFAPYKGPIPGKTDIVVRVTYVTDNGMDVSGGFDLILVYS